MESGIKSDELDLVAFYDKPFLKFERILETYLSFAPKGINSFLKAVPLWIKKKLWTKELIKEKLNYSGKILFQNIMLLMQLQHFLLHHFRMQLFLLWME